jgi:hypothetical protein
MRCAFPPYDRRRCNKAWAAARGAARILAPLMKQANNHAVFVIR